MSNSCVCDISAYGLRAGLLWNQAGNLLLLDVDKSAPRVVVFSPLGDVVMQHPFEKLLSAHADSACRFIGTWKDMLYVADVGKVFWLIDRL